MKNLHSSILLFFVSTILFAQESVLYNFTKEPHLHNCTQTITLQGSTVTYDTQILDSRPTNNFDYTESNTMYSWTNGNKYSLIQFILPSNISSSICSAKLSLYYNPTDPYEAFDLHSGTDNGFTISRITEGWNASTVTWNTRPNVTNINEIVLPPPTSNTQDYPNIEVKQLIKDSFGPSSQLKASFQLRMTNSSSNPPKGLIFASSTNPNSNLHPKLVISYAPAFSPMGLGE